MMNKLTSLYLDLVRAVAAICVVFHHYNNHITDTSRSVFPNIGSEAVIIFFVLSGFVISWVVEVKEKKVLTFFAKRFARFYSVMIPALAIILLSYFATVRIDPNVYPSYVNVGTNFVIPKVILSLTFLNYNSLLYDVRLPTASPFWSLTFEFWYYVIFAAIVFLPKKSLAFFCCFFIFVFLGIKPLLLWPTWLLGSFTYHVSKKISWSKSLASKIFFLTLIGLVSLYLSGIRDDLSMSNIFETGNLSHSNDCIYLFLVAVTVCLNFLAFISWSKNINSTKVHPFLENVTRRLAGISFTLYLTHLPIMFLLKAVLKERYLPYLIPFLAIFLILIIGPFIEGSKLWYYRRFNHIFSTSKKYVLNLGSIVNSVK